MKKLIAAGIVAATAAVTLAPPQAEARGKRFVKVGYYGGYYVRPRLRVVYPVVYTGVCRWYYTPYGAVRRCFY